MEIYLNTQEEKIRPTFDGYYNYKIKEQMPLETFKFFLDLLVVDQSDTLIGLSGSEPLKNPNIADILELTNQYVEAFDFRTSIWTDGIDIYKYIDLFPEITHFNINIKSPEIIGQENFDKLKKSLNSLNERNFLKRRTLKNKGYKEALGTTFTCSLIKEIKDYSYFWELMDKFGMREARVSISLPKTNIKREEYFKEMKKIFLPFIQIAREKDIPLIYECSNIPPCYFNYDELFVTSVYNCNGIRALGWCPRVFQMMPDRSTQLCTCLSHSRIKINNFNDLKDAGNQLFNIREKIEKNIKLPKCINCSLKKNNMCFGGCPGIKGE